MPEGDGMDFYSTYAHSLVEARARELGRGQRDRAHQVPSRRWWRRRPPDAPRPEVAELLPGAHPEAAAFAARTVDVVRVPAGRVILRRGRVPRQVVVIRSGQAVGTDAHGREVTYAAGDRLGDESLQTHTPSTSTVVADTDVEAVVMNAPDFLAAMAS
jgi:CRP-like cAMP-binding protein